MQNFNNQLFSLSSNKCVFPWLANVPSELPLWSRYDSSVLNLRSDVAWRKDRKKGGIWPLKNKVLLNYISVAFAIIVVVVFKCHEITFCCELRPSKWNLTWFVKQRLKSSSSFTLGLPWMGSFCKNGRGLNWFVPNWWGNSALTHER